jgi:hypothetical protein
MAVAWLPFGLHEGARGFAEWLFWVPSFYYHLWRHFAPVVVPARGAGRRAGARLRAAALTRPAPHARARGRR